MGLEKVFFEFDCLEEAIIDSCSLIYMDHAGFLHKLTDHLILKSIPEVQKETNFSPQPALTMISGAKGHTVDQKLVYCAEQKGLPMISEDKKILSRMKQIGLPYFNSLMMLNFLLYKKQLSANAHQFFYKKLVTRAWYGPGIIAFSKQVYTEIL